MCGKGAGLGGRVRWCWNWSLRTGAPSATAWSSARRLRETPAWKDRVASDPTWRAWAPPGGCPRLATRAATDLAVRYQLVSEWTDCLVVHVRAKAERAAELPSLVKVASPGRRLARHRHRACCVAVQRHRRRAALRRRQPPPGCRQSGDDSADDGAGRRHGPAGFARDHQLTGRQRYLSAVAVRCGLTSCPKSTPRPDGAGAVIGRPIRGTCSRWRTCSSRRGRPPS